MGARSLCFKLIALIHHFLNHGAHFGLGQAIAAILVKNIKDLSQLLLLLKTPFSINSLLIDTECMEEVLGHNGEFIECEQAILIGIIAIKQLFETLDDLLLLGS